MDTTQLLKGVLDAAVLAVISQEDGYGYDVVRRLRAAGLDHVGDASVYGTLRRLFTAGSLSAYVVASDGGPNRKYYAITPQGHEVLAEQRLAWATFSRSLSLLLNGVDRPKTLADPDLNFDPIPATDHSANPSLTGAHND
ncbi:PadR family transcriptional regulator [Leucobacter viscericola]|uniref:PadR family transcriptional regulator n=1 Tax=Leucobacter viscericola TaxID=2714935 RepID=A0A6G7XET5_9MICO|nr:PadR family transcriptional regulator [Leucobacter viscericola]QIK63075.1 PadR family transcriptional regulator [Leucobacter viscericola]